MYIGKNREAKLVLPAIMLFYLSLNICVDYMYNIYILGYAKAHGESISPNYSLIFIFFYAVVVIFSSVISSLYIDRFGFGSWIPAIMLVFLGVCLFIFLKGNIRYEEMHFLLSVFRTILFSGLAFFFACWFPVGQHARALGALLLMGWFSNILGSASMPGMWLLISGAIVAFIMGASIWFFLQRKPGNSDWLTKGEESDTGKQVANRFQNAPAISKQASAPLRIAALSFIWASLIVLRFGVVAFATSYAILTTSKEFRLALAQVQATFAICIAVSVIGMLLWAWHSDRTLERKWHVAAPAVIGGLAYLITLHSDWPPLVLGAFTVALAALLAAQPVFWTLPMTTAGEISPGKIGLINAIGSLGIFVAPYTVWMVEAVTGEEAWGIANLAIFPIAAGFLMVVLWGKLPVMKKSGEADIG